MEDDHVDIIRKLWANEWPELDTSPVAVVARVGRAAAHLDRGMEELLNRHGLSRPSFDVLATLRRVGAPHRLSPTQLYRQLMRTSGVMTRRIDSLEAAGLVRRVPDPDDRRGLLVELTAAGRQLIDSVVGPHLDNERRMLAALAEPEQHTLAGLLKKLLLSLEQQQSAETTSGDTPATGRQDEPTSS